MAYTPQLDQANIDVEVWIQTVGNDPLFYGVCTVGLWAGGDVLAIDESERSTVPGTLNTYLAATDYNLAGIGSNGTRDLRIRDPVGLYGKAPLTGEKVGSYRYGKVRARITNDIAATQVGEIMQAITDTQEIEEETGQTVGAMKPMIWEVITTGGSLVDDADIINLHTDITEVVGWLTEQLAAAAGSDESDRRGAVILMLQPYRLITSA